LATNAGFRQPRPSGRLVIEGRARSSRERNPNTPPCGTCLQPPPVLSRAARPNTNMSDRRSSNARSARPPRPRLWPVASDARLTRTFDRESLGAIVHLGAPPPRGIPPVVPANGRRRCGADTSCVDVVTC
jgi:hypothetical protein